MPDTFMPLPSSALFKLAQANLALFTRFATSPEVSAQASEAARRLMQQASESSLRLLPSDAYSQLMQGLLNNYADFMLAFSDENLTMFAQAQQAMTQGLQDAPSAVVDAVASTGRRRATA